MKKIILLSFFFLVLMASPCLAHGDGSDSVSVFISQNLTGDYYVYVYVNVINPQLLDIKISILNIIGTEMITISESGLFHIKLPNPSSGYYFVRVMWPGGTSIERFLKK